MMNTEWKYKGQPLKIKDKWNAELLKQHRWLYYLCITEQNAVNVERVSAMKDITGTETLQYVLRSLDLLEQNKDKLTASQFNILEEVLQWSEVAKGGLEAQRKIWQEKGYPLAIHNLASAEIYKEQADFPIENEGLVKDKSESRMFDNNQFENEVPDNNKSEDNVPANNQSEDETLDNKTLVYTLIQTHGIIGQNIRGEVSACENEPLLALRKKMDSQELHTLLYYLNYCVIGGVSQTLWQQVEEKVEQLISSIIEGKLCEFSPEDRIKALSPAFRELNNTQTEFFAEKIFPHFELWYFDSALSDFSSEQIVEILKKVLQTKGIEKASHITFKPLADSLYYDYEGKKHINIYKKRVIEKYLKNGATDDVKLTAQIKNNTVYVDICFSKVCEKLIEFCVEAERSGLLTYEKSITVLFDMFGFRKDEFDRLNNEAKYLETMNDSGESTKATIADYAVGESIVDVGSGGGIMLDLLEEKYPDRKIIGTDISTNVIETLDKKRLEEGHHWSVVKHNFVDGHFDEKVDTVIFSSILHEVYSYTETENGRFDIETVRLALKNAYDSLKSGGRIVIRDGVKTPEKDSLMKISFNTPQGLSFFKNYVQDFKGLPDVKENRPYCINSEELYAVGDVNFMREFLYTYTWGNESYSHEVQEQFGYFTLQEYKAFFEEMGAKIIEAREFLEPGYEEHLSKLVSLSDAKTGKKVPFPNSNCIVIVEKV